MAPHILYISYDGMTDPLGRSQVIPYLVGLSQRGYRFTVLSAEKKGRYRKGKNDLSALLNKAGIDWVPVRYTKKPPILSTLIDIIKLKKAARKIVADKHIDAVHCRSYIAAHVGQYIKERYHTPWVFDMRGFYADERVDGNIWRLGNLVFRMVYRYFKKKEKEFLSTSDYTISLTMAGREIIKGKILPARPGPDIEVIPCCADMSHFSRGNIDPAKRKRLQKELGLSDNDFVLSYLGSIGTWYLPGEMLDFFKCLLKSRPRSRFLFLSLDDAEMIYQLAEERGIGRDYIKVRGFGREDLPTALSLSQLSIFFIKAVFSKKASSPTKMAELLSMGIPVVANAGVGDVDSLISPSNGLLIKALDTEEYDRAINDIDQLLAVPKEIIEQSAQKTLSLQSAVHRYDKVYRAII